jgi:hypothetical protein
MVASDASATKQQTRAAEIELSEEGPLVVRIRPDVDQTVGDANENLRVAHEIAGDRRPGLLLDLRRARPLEAAVRHVYRAEKVDGFFSALAVVVPGHPLGRMMGNIYLRVAKLGVPTRLFEDSGDALQWLRKLANG